MERNSEECRMFSVGIGDGASTSLVKGIAHKGRGRWEMVTQKDKLQTKVYFCTLLYEQLFVKNPSVTETKHRIIYS